MRYTKVKGHIVNHAYESSAEMRYWDSIIDKATQPAQNFACQFAEDAAIMVLHEDFGFGQDRMEKFCVRFLQTLHEISDLIIKDERDDKQIIYSKAKIDARIKAACGRNFAEWDVRYGRKPAPEVTE